MNVVLMLNEPYFLLLFSSINQFIMKYRTMPGFQQDFMSELFKGNSIPEYWGIFIIQYRLNGAEDFIKQHSILRVNMPYGKVQYQRDVTGRSRTVHKKDYAHGLWFQVGKFMTI